MGVRRIVAAVLFVAVTTCLIRPAPKPVVKLFDILLVIAPIFYPMIKVKT